MRLDFDFQHDFDCMPMTATIRVTTTIDSSPGSYDEPPYVTANDTSVTVLCGKIDITDCIASCADQAAQKEIDSIIDDKIWEQYEF